MAALETLSRRRSGAPRRRRGKRALDGAIGGRGAQLRLRLQAAGPIAARFGIYLGSRVDLFSGSDCLRLLEIPDRGQESPPAQVAALIERELGSWPEELFDGFETEPFDSGLLCQWHRARLPGGEPVTLELVHPELETALEEGQVKVVAERLIATGELPPAARAAVAEFETQLDLRHAVDALEELAEQAAGSPRVEVPEVHGQLCSRRIRVLSAVRGRLPGAPSTNGAGQRARETRARRLGRIWLAMALSGDLFPLEPWGRNIAYAERGRVAFLDGEVHRLPRSCRPELREYLAAVAARQPARAALAFLDLLPDSPTDRRLRDRLRHTDPFRDRGWDIGGDLFARQVLAHWRTAGKLGYRLPEGLLPFYRGLFLLNHEARRLAGDTHAVRDGWREARLLLLVGELRDGAEAGRWSGALERQLSSLSSLPRKLDRILTLATADDRPGTGDDRRGTESEPRRPGGWATVASCLLALTAVVLLTHHVVEAGTFGATVEPLGALLVLFLGGLTLRALGRSGGG